MFANVKGYFLVSRFISPFVSLDCGYGFGAGEFKGLNGMLATPSVGASFNVSKGFALNLSIGYAYQKVNESLLINSGTDNAVMFKLGFQF